MCLSPSNGGYILDISPNSDRGGGRNHDGHMIKGQQVAPPPSLCLLGWGMHGAATRWCQASSQARLQRGGVAWAAPATIMGRTDQK